MSTTPCFLAAGLCSLLAAGVARADDAALTARRAAPHAVYVELLGKGHLYGLGYDYQLGDRLAVGGIASFYVLDGERVTTASGYLAWYPLGGGRHRFFVQAGPQLVNVYTPRVVPELPPDSETGVGAVACAGWEYRAGVLVRAFAMGTAGKGGVAPWLGVSLGWTL